MDLPHAPILADYPATVPLRAVLGLDALVGARVVSGERGLDNPVRWVHCSDLPDIAYWLRGGELLLHTGVHYTATGLVHLVRELSHTGAAGLGISLPPSTIPPDVLVLSDALALPIIAMPDECRFVDVSTAAARLLLAREAQSSLRIAAFWTRVAESNLLSADIHELIAVIANDFLRCPIALYDSAGRLVLAQAIAGPVRPVDLPRTIDQACRLGGAPFPVQIGNVHRGALVALPHGGGEPPDEHLARHAARALGLSLDVSIRVHDLSLRVRSDLFARLLAAPEALWPDLAPRAAHLGIAEGRASRVIALRPGDAHLTDEQAARVLERAIASELGLQPLVTITAQAVHALLPATVGRGDVRRLAAALLRSFDAHADAGGRPRIGVGSPAQSIAELQESARQALAATSSALGAEPAWHEDLKAWELLLQAVGRHLVEPDLQTRLRPLNPRERSVLVDTLCALVECNFNLSAAATRLSLHRNGLRERLQRLSAKTGIDLDDAREAVATWFAVRAQGLSAPGPDAGAVPPPERSADA